MSNIIPQTSLPYLEEFDRQVQNLTKRIWPHTSGIKKEDFLAKIIPLRKRLKAIPATAQHDLPQGKLPFVVVIPPPGWPRKNIFP